MLRSLATKQTERALSYLLRRAGGTYYFRRAIPEALRGAFGGRREWVQTLATKDREEAKVALVQALTAFNEATQKARGITSAPLDTSATYRPPKTPLTRRRRADAISLMKLFDAYAAEQGIKPGTAYEWRSVINRLIAFLGHDDAARLTADDLYRWTDALQAEPAKGGKPRTARTVRGTYLGAVRATLMWAKQKRKLPENVAEGLTIRVPKRVKLREPDFTNDEAKRILSATLAYPSDETATGQAFARRWIPWLCAYTGARVNELSQLRQQDIQQIDGIWAIRITPEAGTVKTNTARTVPLHPHIIEQGFIEVIANKPHGPLFYDPSRSTSPGPVDRYFKKVGEGLAAWVRSDLGIDDPLLQPNHAWRHTFKTLAIAAEIPERLADALQGHAPRSIGQTYGTVPFGSLVKAINSIPYYVL